MQEALDEALRQYMGAMSSNPDSVQYENVAEHILLLKDELVRERTRRDEMRPHLDGYDSQNVLWQPGRQL